MTRKLGLQSLGEVLEQRLDLGGRHPLSPSVWRSIVGDKVYRHTRPERVERDVLLITVGSSVWAQELSLLETELLSRLKSRLPRVRGLRFQVGHVLRRLPATLRIRVAPAPLPPELEARLARLDDLALRQSISEAASYCFGREIGAEKQRATGVGRARPDT